MKISVLIKPNSRKGPLVERQDDGSFVVFVREPAVDGKANQALIELLASYFNVSKTSAAIIRGHTSRHKVVEILITS